MQGKDLLFKLSNSIGVSGYEHGLSGVLEEYFKPYSDEISYGKLGDFVAKKKGDSGGAFKIMLAAHCDEVGLIVTEINEKGFVHFTDVNGVDAKTMPAQEVIIHGKRDVYGVVGAKPPHVLSAEDMSKAIKMEDMKIDTGIEVSELKSIVSVGDLITVKRDCINLLGDTVCGKALDDRAGIALMHECAKELQKLKHAPDVYFVATTQEERGCLGALVMSYDINPDIGIAVDVTFGDKYALPEIESELGKGVEITVGGNIHPELFEKLTSVADDYKIPYCVDASPAATGTDATNIQISREGIATLLISIPLKYMHTSTEVIDYKDVQAGGRLLAQFIASIKDWGDIYNA